MRCHGGHAKHLRFCSRHQRTVRERLAALIGRHGNTGGTRMERMLVPVDHVAALAKCTVEGGARGIGGCRRTVGPGDMRK